MSAEDRLRELARATAEAARAPLAGDGRYLPGDLFLSARACEGGVRWALLDVDADGALHVVPADVSPLVGSADVELAPDAPGGPLTLRCGAALWLPSARLDPAERVGCLAANDLNRVRERVESLREGTHRGSVFGREVDEDPEYEDWISEVVEPARIALRDALGPGELSPDEASEQRAGSPRWGGIGRLPLARAMAAVFALATVGLLLLTSQLRQDVEVVHQARATSPAAEIDFRDLTRGSETGVEGEREGTTLLLLLPIGEPPWERFTTELLSPDGEVLQTWEVSSRQIQRGTVSEFSHVEVEILLLPRHVRPGLYYLVIHGERGQHRELVGERVFRVEEEK